MPRLHLRFARTCGTLAASLLLAGAVHAEGETCTPSAPGAVSLIVLQSASAVHELAKAMRGDVVTRDATTVVFADGRVISSDVGKVGDHLNALGWSTSHIDMVSSLPARRARPRRAAG
jgi:hypothetical protein